MSDLRYTPIQDVEYTTTHVPRVGSRLAALKPGTRVLLTEKSGREHEVEVQRFNRDGSPDHAALTVGYGPGRWNREVSAARILAGHVGLAVPSATGRTTA